MVDSNFSFCWVILIIIVIGIVAIIIHRKEITEKTNVNYEKCSEELKNKGFVTSNRIQLLSTEVRVDTEHKRIAILFPMYTQLEIIKFSEIIRCETIQDNSTILSGGVGRAIVGGILVGGVGAVVGANTRKSKDVVYDLKINITTNNINNPLITIQLINSQTERSSLIYHKCIEFAEKVQATMESIISQQ